MNVSEGPRGGSGVGEWPDTTKPPPGSHRWHCGGGGSYRLDRLEGCESSMITVRSRPLESLQW